nr:flagellar basal body L-ring protein FlgH [Paenalcaligenes suwonensis]
MKVMMRSLFVAMAVAIMLIQGCALVPPEAVVTGPLTAQPPAQILPEVVANGSIYQPSAYGNYPLFEDRRPRNVGDIVTIVIQERTNAAKNVSTSTNRNSSGGLNFGADPSIFLANWVPDKTLKWKGKTKLTVRVVVVLTTCSQAR